MATRRLSLLFQKHLHPTFLYLRCSSSSQHSYFNVLHFTKCHFSNSEIQQIEEEEEDEYDEYEYDDDDEEEAAFNHDDEYDSDSVDDDDDDEDDEGDSDEEDSDVFVHGHDSDDEFTETLEYDVRDDPWWNEMLPGDQQKFLFKQRHKNPEAWPNGIVPHAAKTSHFDLSTIRALKRYPNLGKFAQSYTEENPGKWNWDIENVRLNSVDQLNRGIWYKQPPYKQIVPMIHRKEVAKRMNPEVDYRFKSGDVIDLVMYTNLQKKKTQRIQALVLMVRKKWEIAGSFMIRNVEKDGLCVIRQYPLHSPWIKSLQIKERYKVKRRKLYYMYKAPADATDPVSYGDSIGVRSRSEHFKWLKETDEGLKYARDYKLKRRMYFHGMRYRQGWARRLANLYNATAMTKNMKGPYRNAKREMKYRIRVKPHNIDDRRFRPVTTHSRGAGWGCKPARKG